MNAFSFFLTVIFYAATALWIYFCFYNFQPMQQTMPLFVFGWTVTVPIFYVVIGTYVLSGVLFSLLLFSQFEKIGKPRRFNPLQEKHVEKISVDKETAEMKVRVLEEKIKTLEVALDKALKKD